MIRRNAVLSLAGALLALSSVSQAEPVYRILPFPDCGDYIDCPKPKPNPWDCVRLSTPCDPDPLGPWKGKLEAITASVADGSFQSAGQGLEALYMGSASGGAAPAVIADAKKDPNPPTIFYPDAKTLTRPVASSKGTADRAEVPAPGILLMGAEGVKIIPIDCSDSNGCRSETGKVIEDATSGLGKLVDKLIGEPLRDSGDAALKKGNEDKKRAEDEWKKK